MTFNTEYLKTQNISSIVIQLAPKTPNTHWYFDRYQDVVKLAGIGLTTASFDQFIKGFGSVFIVFAVFFFAYSTLITWSYYGETAILFLFGPKGVLPYKALFVLLILVGAVESLDTVINFSDAMIGLLVIPNMIALLFLHPKVKQWTTDYYEKLKTGEIKAFN